MKRSTIAFAVIVILYLLAAAVDPCDGAPGCNSTTINNQ
jgi:hypothetical protein